MALYDGFFDAVLDEDTYQYDREYDSGSFTEYYANLIGSGVCIHNNTDSMLVTWDGTAAVMAPGYLFIDGHWLKNTANYSVPVSGEGTYAILATLNMGTRRIEVETQPKADPEEYPDSLCLAYVTIDSAGAATVEDTRYNTEICGVIDTAGALSGKIEYVINYIDNEINAKLEQAEADIAAQAAVLDAKVAEVSAMVEKLAPPPIGTVKFSASSEIEDGWLRCDGSFISETDYPELVAALGKHTPGVEEFNQIVTETYQGEFSNAYLVDDTYWVYHITGQQLLGFSVDGSLATKTVTGIPTLVPSADAPVVLSIVEDRAFIAQCISVSPYIHVYQALEFSTITEPTFSELDFSGHAETLSSLYTIYPMGRAYPEVCKITGISVGDTVGGSGTTLTEAFAVVPFISYNRTQPSGSNYYAHYLRCWRYMWSGAETMDGGTEDVAMAYLYKNSSIMDSKYLNILNAVRCSRINSNEIFFLYNNAFSYQSKSAPLGLFNATDMSDVTITDFPEYAGAENPVAYNNQFFVRAVVSGKTFTAVTGTVSPSTVVIHEVQLPVSNARMFCDSMYCVKSQMLWLAFVGTGIMFSRDIANGVWGYLDTSSVLGIVTQYGSIEYDEANQQLFIAGKNSTGKYVVGVMKFPNWYDFANDGAFLPMIASNGVPAYIKALDTTTEEA